MHPKFRATVTGQLQAQPNDPDVFFEIELYYLIRECVNRIDPARIADIGENGYQTGVSEYDGEAFSIFLEVQTHYQQRKQLNKNALHAFLQKLFAQQFWPGIFQNEQAQVMAQSIYNEIYKIDPGHRLNGLDLKISKYAVPITNSREYTRYIDRRALL